MDGEQGGGQLQKGGFLKRCCKVERPVGFSLLYLGVCHAGFGTSQRKVLVELDLELVTNGLGVSGPSSVEEGLESDELPIHHEGYCL